MSRRTFFGEREQEYIDRMLPCAISYKSEKHPESFALMGVSDFQRLMRLSRSKALM